MKYNIFIYGTLKKGLNNHYILKRTKFIGTGILKNYGIGNLYNDTLVKEWDHRDQGLPYISPCPGMEAIGEVYKVSAHRLWALDVFEANGRLYKRRTEEILINGKTIKAEVYHPYKLIKQRLIW